MRIKNILAEEGEVAKLRVLGDDAFKIQPKQINNTQTN